MSGLPRGVQRKHTRSCATRRDPKARCRCNGGYQVQAGPRGARKTRTFASLDAAVAWKRDVEKVRATSRHGAERAPTLRDAADVWERDARAGVALARGRRPFKPGTIRDYRRSLDVDLLPDYGAVRLDDLGERLPAVVAGLQRRGLAASSVRNAIMPLRAIYRHAQRMGWTTANPTRGLEVPAGSGRRIRILTPAEIPVFLAALPERDRPLWATAVYAGLRRGELMALRWADVDLAGGLISVDPEQGAYDPKGRMVAGPKSRAGARRVPVGGDLRDHLAAHRARAGARPMGLVFARASLAGRRRGDHGAEPFSDTAVMQRARRVWTDAGLLPVGLHDCRHTFASLAIAAMAARGVFNPKLLQSVMGHSSIQVTYDRYGHLFPGQEAELGLMLDDLLAVRPPVAERSSREQTCSNDGVLPSGSLRLAPPGDRAAQVQRGTTEGADR